jgi:hypothetical protein
VLVASQEDEEAKKRVQEAVWAWTQRLLVLAVVFGFGFFSGWVLYGYGPQGAPALRLQTVKQDADLVDCKNKRVDVEGKLTVTEGRLTQCQSDLQKARTAGAPPAPANP